MNLTGDGVHCLVPMPVACSDIFGNPGGDWIGYLAGELGTDGNICEDPLFCGADLGDLTLDFSSPCLSAECGRMGSWGLGCPAASVEDAPAANGLRVRPNPMTASCRLECHLARPGRISVLILDVGGRIVRRLYRGWAPGGALSLPWNRRDDGGRAVPGGLYLARILGSSASTVERVVVLP